MDGPSDAPTDGQTPLQNCFSQLKRVVTTQPTDGQIDGRTDTASQSADEGWGIFSRPAKTGFLACENEFAASLN